MIKKILAGAVAAAITCLPLAAHADLIGQSVQGQYDFPSTSAVFQNDGSQVVAPTATFIFATGVPNTTVVVGANNVTVSFDSAGTFNTATFNGPALSFSVPDISNVTLDSATTLSGFTATDIAFTANSLFLNLQGLIVSSASNKVIVDVATRSTSVPEPITLSIFGAGLVGAGALRRRKKTKAEAA